MNRQLWLFDMWKNAKPPPAKRKKTTEETLEHRRQYDQTRSRSFQTSWYAEFDRLIYGTAADAKALACETTDNTPKANSGVSYIRMMHCKVCLRFGKRKGLLQGLCQRD